MKTLYLPLFSIILFIISQFLSVTSLAQGVNFSSEYDRITWPVSLGVGGGITGDDGSYKRVAIYHGNSISLQVGSNSPNIAYSKLFINASGNVGIGTTNPDQKLAVNGKIKCEEVIVVVDVADYVFEETYPLKKLEEVDQYIKENKHLPGVPGKKEVDANGYEVGLMTNKLLEKVEELTLYMIEQNKEIKALKEENKKITTELARLEVKNK